MVLDDRDGPNGGVTSRRRRAVEAGHAADVDTARDLVVDPSPRVRASALQALARLGALDVATLSNGLQDPQPEVRRRAAELAAATTEPGLLDRLRDPDPAVIEVAAWALGERPLAVVSDEERAALRAIAAGHDDALCREAAVAALGALGAPDDLPTVLTALSDRPPIRRRAVIALAAFEGPEVTEALRRATGDRDWQVRQAAEDLLRLEDGWGDDEPDDEPSDEPDDEPGDLTDD